MITSGKRCRSGDENRLVTVIQTGDKARQPPGQETRYDDDSDRKAESSLTRSACVDDRGDLEAQANLRRRGGSALRHVNGGEW